MTLDPQCAALLQAIAETGSPFDTDDPREARARVAATTRPLPDPDARFAEVRTGAFPGPGGSIGYRLYRPLGVAERKAPALVFYHGGGMVFGTLDSHDPICREAAIGAGCVVISIDYRLAPEARFPAAMMDAWAAFLEVVDRAEDLGVDTDRIAVGGDSAGGNLAAVVSLTARDVAGPRPCFQWLIYPNTDMADPASAPAGGSIDRFSEGYFLTRDALSWIQSLYLEDDAQRADWRASPLRAPSLAGVAPALVQTAGFDPLKDEGVAYAERLRQDGVPTAHTDYPGMIHGFIRAIGVVDTAQIAIEEGAAALRLAFATAA